MNLAFVAKSIGGRGGTERDLDQLVRGLARRGHAVTLYLQQTGGSLPAGCRIVRVPGAGWGPLARLWSLAWLGPRLAGRGGHDLVTGFARLLRQDVVRCGGGTHAGYLDALATVDSPARAAFRRFHPHHRSILAIERLQYLPGRYRRVLAISDTVRADLIRTYHVPESAIEVIHDGVDTIRFQPGLRTPHRAAIRARYGLPPASPVALFVGNGFRRKGLEPLLHAFANLPAEWRLLVVGGDPEAARYRALAGRLGVADRVTFAGPQGSPEPFYAASDCLVLPAIQEAFGNVVLEALACGLPAVVSRGAGAASVLAGGLEAGIVTHPGNPGELADRMRAVQASAAALLPIARRTAERHSLDVHTGLVESFFERVIQQKRVLLP